MSASVTTTTLLVLFLTATVSAQEEDPLAELAALGDAIAEMTPEGGGSIRAKRSVDTALQDRIKDKRNVEAKVDFVKQGKFPRAAVRVKVLNPAKQGAGKDVKKNDTLVLIPEMMVTKGSIALDDEATMINAGAYYLVKGDKVMIRLGQKSGKVWKAQYIERKK
ncbi:MAG: hypothetical protein R3C68_06430 [Myxococcota bacterium]